MNKFCTILIAVAVLSAAQVAIAAHPPTFSSTFRDPTAAEIADDATLAGQIVNQFFVTTEADILQFDTIDIQIGGAALFQHTFGDDDSPPNPAFLPSFPSLAADSWITTPGGTSIAGGGFGDLGAAWFDTSDDNAQDVFMFAQLTTAGMGTFSGRIQLKGLEAPEIYSFDLPVGIPEPNTLILAGLSLVGIFASRRRNS